MEQELTQEHLINLLSMMQNSPQRISGSTSLVDEGEYQCLKVTLFVKLDDVLTKE